MLISITLLIVGLVFVYGWGAVVNSVFDGTSVKEGLDKEVAHHAKHTVVGKVIESAYDSLDK